MLKGVQHKKTKTMNVTAKNMMMTRTMDAHDVLLYRHTLLPKVEHLVVVYLHPKSPFGKPSKGTFFI